MLQIIKIVKSQLKTTLFLMMTKSMIESDWAEDMGQFLYHLDPDTKKITRSLEKIKLKIINSVPLSLTKLAWIITCYLNIHSSIYIYVCVFVTHLPWVGYDTRLIFKWSTAGSNSVFPFLKLITKPRLKNLICPIIFPIAGRKTYGLIPFPRAFVQSQIQTALSSIWTPVLIPFHRMIFIRLRVTFFFYLRYIIPI